MKTQVLLFSFFCVSHILFILFFFFLVLLYLELGRKHLRDGMALISKIFNMYLAEMKSLIYRVLTTIHFVNG